MKSNKFIVLGQDIGCDSCVVDNSKYCARMGTGGRRPHNPRQRSMKSVDAVLFFDLAFDSVQIDEVNRVGAPVYDEDGNPKKRVVAVPFLVMVLISRSNLLHLLVSLDQYI